MTKLRLIVAGMLTLLLSVFALPTASATPGQENYPNNLKWGHPTICVNHYLPSTWDTAVQKAATQWGLGNRLTVVVRHRTLCDPVYLDNDRMFKIYPGERPDGILATTTNETTGTFPNKVITYSDVIVDTSKFSLDTSRQRIICHEMGHSLGVGHYLSEDTCMNEIMESWIPVVPHERDKLVIEERYGVA